MADALPGNEREMLLSWLDGQRNHVVGAVEGLEEADLQRVMVPTGWSCTGLIQHLALDVERFWFRCVITGEADAIASLDTGPGNAWIVPPGISASQVIALYRREIELANEIIRKTSLDATPVWWPGERFGDWHIDTVRELILHVMTETATHAGHLDIVRELIDGKQWLVLTE